MVKKATFVACVLVVVLLFVVGYESTRGKNDVSIWRALQNPEVRADALKHGIKDTQRILTGKPKPPRQPAPDY